MNKIKWGIIGCGDVCEVKSGPAFSKIEHSELVTVMRRNAERAEDYAYRHQVPVWYSDADDLINDPEVNAVYVATPPNSHLEYVLKVAQAGKPIYVEKPMGRTYAECQQMIEACEKAGVPLFVAYYRRQLPYFLKVKELIESGIIGTITVVNLTLLKSPKIADADPNLNWRVNPEISGGGHFHDLASHQLDLLAYYFGDFVDIVGIASNALRQNAAEDTVTASFKFESGLIGSGSWTFTSLASHQKDQVQIIGDKGTITFCCFNDTTPIVLETDSKRQEFSIPYPQHVQQPLIQTIVDELRGIGNCPSTGHTGAKANWVMDKVLGKI
ncbi:MAG: Gfo/Idh/MocA family oxidoreductase [Balneolaceae bacterium]|nr:Gfo/Idh/MocA family oxidoreductase [Balneolaceae bacterium]MBO6545813.1 Gfo/Idh/MocA family oxidoreductase [Balneolaceae bacterium]MBO6647209.1 Gfo/Idh/MocA family oxidoreductase [Balneolaceae bacterium]